MPLSHLSRHVFALFDGWQCALRLGRKRIAYLKRTPHFGSDVRHKSKSRALEIHFHNAQRRPKAKHTIAMEAKGTRCAPVSRSCDSSVARISGDWCHVMVARGGR